MVSGRRSSPFCNWLSNCSSGDWRVRWRHAWQPGVVGLVGEVDVAGYKEHRTTRMLAHHLNESGQDTIIVVVPVEPGQTTPEVRFDGQCPQGDLVLADHDAAQDTILLDLGVQVVPRMPVVADEQHRVSRTEDDSTILVGTRSSS